MHGHEQFWRSGSLFPQNRKAQRVPIGGGHSCKCLKRLAPQVGLEPTTLRLTAGCSAIELLRSGQIRRHRVWPTIEFCLYQNSTHLPLLAMRESAPNIRRYGKPGLEIWPSAAQPAGTQQNIWYFGNCACAAGFRITGHGRRCDEYLGNLCTNAEN